MVAFLIALLPSAGVLVIFWIGIKALLEADRRERAAQARIEAQQGRDNRSGSRSGSLSGKDAASAARAGEEPS